MVALDLMFDPLRESVSSSPSSSRLSPWRRARLEACLAAGSVLPIALSVGSSGLDSRHDARSTVPRVDEEARFPIGTAVSVPALVLGIAGLGGDPLRVRHRSSESIFAGAVVAGTLILATLDCPLDWFPAANWTLGLRGNRHTALPYRGLTSGLHEG